METCERHYDETHITANRVVAEDILQEMNLALSPNGHLFVCARTNARHHLHQLQTSQHEFGSERSALANATFAGHGGGTVAVGLW